MALLRVFAVTVTVFEISLLAFRETSALEWTSSASLPNGTKMAACTGQKITLPWTFNLSDSEQIIDIEWHYESVEGVSKGIASYIFGHFQPMPTAHQNLGYLPNAGLELSNITVADSGLYSVLVSLRGAADSPTQMVTLEVSDPPVMQYDRLEATLSSKAVLDNATGEWHIQVLCGRFASLGQPPITILWKSPTGNILPSTSEVNGVFTLTVPNPPQGGDYTCFPDNATSSSACVDSASAFHGGATVHVDGITSRLAIMDGRLGALQTESEALNNEVASARHESKNHTDDVESIRNRLQELINTHPADCRDVQNVNKSSGVYTIYLSYDTTLPVYCDMDTDGGGWTVIQKRQDGSVDFYRNWHQYERFFGNIHGEFWLGLTNIHRLTSRERMVLRVDLEAFDGSTAYAEYSSFQISGADDNYRLNITGFSGTAGNGLDIQNGLQFTTYDSDHDTAGDGNCAVSYHGARWYNACHASNLNGRYKPSSVEGADGVVWKRWTGTHTALKKAEMKVRSARV